jgi:hypothetical protein
LTDALPRYGCLKDELITGHRKGSGIFGSDHEVDIGDVLLIEVVSVDKKYRRKGIVTNMIKTVLKQAKESAPSLRFAFVWPTVLNPEIPAELPEEEQMKLRDDAEAAAIALHRKSSFRRVGSSIWFAYAFDQDHASRKLAAEDDYDPPRPRPALTELEKLELALERKRTRYEHGMLTVVVSDRFKGHADADVKKLLQLRDVVTPSPDEFARIKYGCTCSECLGGWLSPRTRVLMKITCEYEHDQDMYDDMGEVWEGENAKSSIIDGFDFSIPVSWMFLSPQTVPYMKSNKSVRTGHRHLFGHIIASLDQNQVPTVKNILKVVEEAGEWPPVTRNFIQRAGNKGIEDTLKYVITAMLDKDLKAGNGIDVIAEYEENKAAEEKLKAAGKDSAEGKDKFAWLMRNHAHEDGAFEWVAMKKEKECRNDSEFGFLFGMMTGKVVSSQDEFVMP